MNMAQERFGYTLISEVVFEIAGAVLEMGLAVLDGIFSSDEEEEENQEEEHKNEQ